MRTEFRYEAMVPILFARVPGFADQRLAEDNSRPYVVFGDLALCLRVAAERGAGSSILVRQAFDLLNEMLESPNEQVVDLALVGVLEVLTDRPASLALATQFLSPKGQEVLANVVVTLKGDPSQRLGSQLTSLAGPRIVLTILGIVSGGGLAGTVAAASGYRELIVWAVGLGMCAGGAAGMWVAKHAHKAREPLGRS